MRDAYDVVIIGGGPAGISAAIYASRAKLKTLVLDKNPNAGALAAAERIENYPGIPGGISGKELLTLFRRQAEMFGAEIVQAQVMAVDFSEEMKKVITPEGTYTGRTVIIATGSMGHKPTIAGEERFIGRGVSYCATCDAPFFRDKIVAVVGEVDKVREEMEVIAKFASKVYLISPKRGDETTWKKHSEKIELLAGAQVVEIFGSEVVEGVRIKDADNKERKIALSGVFMFLQGSKPIVDFLYGALEMGEDGCINVNEEMGTSVEGVYAAGDVRCRKIRQVILAAADGCIAALSAEKYLNKRKRARVQWS